MLPHRNNVIHKYKEPLQPPKQIYLLRWHLHHGQLKSSCLQILAYTSIIPRKFYTFYLMNVQYVFRVHEKTSPYKKDTTTRKTKSVKLSVICVDWFQMTLYTWLLVNVTKWINKTPILRCTFLYQYLDFFNNTPTKPIPISKDHVIYFHLLSIALVTCNPFSAVFYFWFLPNKLFISWQLSIFKILLGIHQSKTGEKLAYCYGYHVEASSPMDVFTPPLIGH